MNKKGFTLLELLAIVVILALLAIISGTVFTKAVKESKEELYNKQLESIKLAAEAWGTENLLKLPDDGECKYITLKNLKEYGLLDKDIKNPKTNEEFSNELKIKITSKVTNEGILRGIYEINPNNLNGCKPVYPPICTLVSDEDSSNSITPGDKYQCKVKENMELEYENGYNFYVLGINEDKTINLIMDQNIYSDGTPAGINGVTKSTNTKKYSLVAWNNETEQKTNLYGPVTAMQFLYNATKDWINVPPINYSYNDKQFQGGDSGYTSFVSKDGIATITSSTSPVVKTNIGTKEKKLRARMPIYKLEDSKEYGELLFKSIAPYLYDNFDTTGSSAPWGYWTLSSSVESSSNAWYLYYYSNVNSIDVTIDSSYGVRPVITLDKSEFSK